MVLLVDLQSICLRVLAAGSECGVAALADSHGLQYPQPRDL